MRVSLDSSSLSRITGGCEGTNPTTTMEGLRSQLGIEGPVSCVSSWLSSSLEYSTSTIKSLSGRGPSVSEDSSSTASVNDDDNSWRNVTNIPTTPGGSAVSRGKCCHSADRLSTPLRSTVGRTETNKNVQNSQQAAKDRLAKAVADARKCNKDARLLQHMVLASSLPAAPGSTSTSRPKYSLTTTCSAIRCDTKQKAGDTPNHLPSDFKAKRTTNKDARVQFDLNQNRTIGVPRVDPADKPILFYRPKQFRVMNRDEQNLFHAYHFYQEMYNQETSFDTKEALRRRMSSIANLMLATPGGGNDKTKKKKTPVKKRKRTTQKRKIYECNM